MIGKPSISIRLAIAAAVLAIVICGAWFVSRGEALVAKATSGVAVNAVPGSVAVEAEYIMEIKSEIGGRVSACNLLPGTHVKEGDVLIELDTRDVALEVERIETDYDAAKKRIAVGSALAVELANVRDDVANAVRLHGLGQVSDMDLKRTKRLLETTEQRKALEEVNNEQLIKTYENTLQVKRRQMQKMTVVAPFDGVVSFVGVDARKGSLIGGGALIAKVISNTRTVIAKISEENFAGIKIGQKAKVRFLPYGAELFDATVSKILPTADPGTQRYIIYLDVNIAADRLRPDITGEVTVTVDERPSDTIIPRRALFGRNVYVVRDGRVRLQPVTVGFVSLTAVEVLNGLSKGDYVIIDKIDQFRDGDRVRIKEVDAL